MKRNLIYTEQDGYWRCACGGLIGEGLTPDLAYQALVQIEKLMAAPWVRAPALH